MKICQNSSGPLTSTAAMPVYDEKLNIHFKRVPLRPENLIVLGRILLLVQIKKTNVLEAWYIEVSNQVLKVNYTPEKCACGGILFSRFQSVCPSVHLSRMLMNPA